MPRMPHGAAITASELRQAQNSTAASMSPMAFEAFETPELKRFDYMFLELQSQPDALIPVTADTVNHLRALAGTMGDDGSSEDSGIPAAYTYFGQFVDHDITLETHIDETLDTLPEVLADNMSPLSLDDARSLFKNKRTATFDLDSVYDFPAPKDPQDIRKLRLGTVDTDSGSRPPNKDDDNDVFREGPNADHKKDRAALIGDPRNDENTVISQLQVAFIKAHNRLVDEGFTFDQARSILRQHYQYVVVHDFLRTRIADRGVVDDILEEGNQWYDAMAEPFFMPLEFSFAAYRFGHTMVRAAYDFNVNFNLASTPATLELLFTFSALSGQLGGEFGFNFQTLPENWIIQWENMIGEGLGSGGLARPLDTKISARIGSTNSAMLALRDTEGKTLTTPPFAEHIAARNLLRGYRHRIPTGQAVAHALGLPELTEQDLRDAVTDEQEQALETGGFLTKTPLWFYILAEAAHHRRIAPAGSKPDHLGPVGSTIVAEVLIGLVRRSADSILRLPGWHVALPVKGAKFELADLLRFAGVMDEKVTLKTHVVKSGETLSAIAKKHLGAANRWPEIFAANRVIVRDPNLIEPGMRLIVPSAPAPDPKLRFVVVKHGDTLSKLAQKHLDKANRWPEIFKLNRGVLTDPNRIIAGQVLQLPAS